MARLPWAVIKNPLMRHFYVFLSYTMGFLDQYWLTPGSLGLFQFSVEKMQMPEKYPGGGWGRGGCHA